MRWSAFLLPKHALITHLCCVFTGEGTHLPQSSYAQLSPTTAPHRSSDLPTFLHILHSQDLQQHILLVWIKQNLASTEGGGGEAFWIQDPLTVANSPMEVFWNSFIHRTDDHVFKIDIFSMCIFLSCLWWWYLNDHILTCTRELDE